MRGREKIQDEQCIARTQDLDFFADEAKRHLSPVC
jgi:hypothetical protein